MTILTILALLWGAGIWILNRDLDREQTARRKAANVVRPLSHDELAAWGLYRIRDAEKRARWASTRYQDQQMWEMRRHEAEHIRDIRQLRLLWDGVVRIGEDVA